MFCLRRVPFGITQKDCIIDGITFIKPAFTCKSSRFDFYVETAGERGSCPYKKFNQVYERNRRSEGIFYKARSRRRV